MSKRRLLLLTNKSEVPDDEHDLHFPFIVIGGYYIPIGLFVGVLFALGVIGGLAIYSWGPAYWRMPLNCGLAIMKAAGE